MSRMTSRLRALGRVTNRFPCRFLLIHTSRREGFAGDTVEAPLTVEV
jgi:hypothetical protein